MAYLRKLTPHKCEYSSFCGKRATVQLVDRWNGTRGYFCTPHGKKKLDEQTKNEEAAFSNNGKT
jgi:hypothetical protein